ncbi:TOMM system kinase/cyclase fusion protein [Myxococcus sp. RHSTA-1-4]|uniref:TOMM system kinase/cyclase fusion protein n=1 Tax=Myxococcus sp. RHSTA-1-4 TaxID=2874601 RepID=UPI001CBAB578|nr:TOMM system kinase/cyclase fusion protein [Myxococcus sp. RHSTA-1-4]MBZ4423294.1 TOMM system kinase/cyclase fusion protein [Myxococcus sp. RHSTA-1-4]
MLDPKRAFSAVFEGRYEFQGELGQGGFGTVYRARQLATGQSVAIKVLRFPEGGTEESNERRLVRFRREMQICAQMHHPNIVRLMDSGQADGGIVYSIFEFVPGKNLAEVLKEEGGLDPGEARHLMMQTLDALACAHAQGVVHRDFKPANIMIIPTGARRNALVLDFGIGAITAEDRHEHGARITQTHESIGTPSYAAPEQLRGLPPTPRSDLYAWGLVFMECLTGEQVIKGQTAAEVMFQQLSADPILVPTFLADHPLGGILRRVTAKDPLERDVTAESILRELEGCDVRGLPRKNTGPRRLDASPAEGAAATVQFPSTPQGEGEALRIVEGERRQITAVGINLGASGVVPHAADMEEFDQVLGVQQDACIEIARGMGGHVAGALGESVLFYFGFPTAREDDAQRAARAALAMVSEVNQRSAALEVERKVRVNLRVGIHTGLVVSRELRESMSGGFGYVVGTTPKLATRLAALAEPGCILVSAGTQRLLREQFLLEETGPRAVDDATAPIETFVLREGAPSHGPRDVSLVGREREIATLLDCWGRVNNGVGQAILLSGEPGIGKSRLVREFAERLGAEPHLRLKSRCTPDSVNSAFHPIIELLDRLLDPQRELKLGAKAGKLEVLLSSFGFSPAEAMPLFAPLLSIPLSERWAPLDVSPQKRREMTCNAVLSLLFEMAEREPVVLVVEDLHWADPSTLELLGQLASEVGSARVLALFTARTEFTPSWPRAGVLHLQLGRLGRPEIDQLAARLTGSRALPANVLEEIARRTDGIPLFVEELVRMMLETGTLVEQSGTYAFMRPLTELSIPTTLRDSLVARLDRLGKAKETAQIAAVIGREFTFELLRAVSPLDSAAVQRNLEGLVAADLVHRKRRLKSEAYLFKHALVRDAAYESMLKRSRREVHARVAKALEEKLPETTHELLAILAHHYTEAGLPQPAVSYWLKAGQRDLANSANLEAIDHLNRGLSLLEQLSDAAERDRCELDLLTTLAPALMASRAYAAADVERAYLRARELCQTVGQTPATFLALWGLFTFYLVSGQLDKAIELGEQMLRIGASRRDETLTLGAHTALGAALFYQGAFETARRHLDEAVALDRKERDRSLAAMTGQDVGIVARMYSALVACFTGFPERAVRSCEEAIAMARELGHAFSLAFALTFAALVRQFTGERQESRAWLAELLTICEKQGFTWWLICGRMQLGWALLEEPGRGDEALSLMRSNQEVLVANGAVNGQSQFLSFEVESLLRAGRLEEARRRLEMAFAAMRQAQETHCESELHRLDGELKLAAGVDETGAEAERSFRRALEVAHRQGARLMELRAATSLCRLPRNLGRDAEARSLLEQLHGDFTDGHQTPFLREARATLAMLE